MAPVLGIYFYIPKFLCEILLPKEVNRQQDTRELKPAIKRYSF